MVRADNMASSEFVARIAAEDFYMQVCKRYSESDGPFGHVDCKPLVNALRTAFSEAKGAGDEMAALPRGVLPRALRDFLGASISYEQQLCAVFADGYSDRSGAFDASALV